MDRPPPDFDLRQSIAFREAGPDDQVPDDDLPTAQLGAPHRDVEEYETAQWDQGREAP